MMIKPIEAKQIESAKRKDIDQDVTGPNKRSRYAQDDNMKPTIQSLLKDTGSSSKGSYIEKFVQSLLPKRENTNLLSSVEGLYESFELEEDDSDIQRLPQKGESIRLRFRWHPECLPGKAGDKFWIHYDPYDWFLVWKDQQRAVDLSTIGIVQCQLPRDIVLGGDLMEVTVLQSISFSDFPKFFQPRYDNHPIERFEAQMRHLGDNGDDAEHLTNFQWCNWSDEDGRGQEMMFVKCNGSWYLVGTHTWDENKGQFHASFTYVLPENAVKLNLMRQKSFWAKSTAKYHCC